MCSCPYGFLRNVMSQSDTSFILFYRSWIEAVMQSINIPHQNASQNTPKWINQQMLDKVASLNSLKSRIKWSRRETPFTRMSDVYHQIIVYVQIKQINREIICVYKKAQKSLRWHVCDKSILLRNAVDRIAVSKQVLSAFRFVFYAIIYQNIK